MNNVKDALDKARVDAQQLHQGISETTAKNHATIRVELQNAADRARDLAASLKEVADAQEADSKQHIKDATTALDHAAKSAKNIASSNDSDLKAVKAAMLINATAAVRNLSRAVAAKRSASKLVKR